MQNYNPELSSGFPSWVLTLRKEPDWGIWYVSQRKTRPGSLLQQQQAGVHVGTWEAAGRLYGLHAGRETGSRPALPLLMDTSVCRWGSCWLGFCELRKCIHEFQSSRTGQRGAFCCMGHLSSVWDGLQK